MKTRKYVVIVDGITTHCSMLTLVFASIYRRIRGFSKPRVIGSYSDV